MAAGRQLLEAARAVPSAQEAPTMWQALPRLPHSSSAVCRAFWMSARDTIDQLAGDIAKAPQAVPNTLSSATHCAGLHCARALATLRDAWPHAMPHWPALLS